MNTPSPALVTRDAARRLPRWPLLLLCAAYVLPGVFSRDPWRNADISAFGYMLSIAEGRSSWLAPTLGGLPAETALLPHWLGALFMRVLPGLEAPLASRLPFAALLVLVLALTWYTTYHLARTEAAQPVALAFGGEAEPVDYARAIADAAVLALIACLGLLQLGHETTPELPQLFAVALFLWSLAAAPFRPARAGVGTVAALILLALSGAPSMALAMGVIGCIVCARSSFGSVRRHAGWVAAGTVAGSLLAWQLGAWQWRLAPQFEPPLVGQVARLWVWFLWPAWPLAMWTLWRWRRQLLNRHVSVPLLTVGVALAACVLMGASDRALMLGLPGMAVLAAFALPTLARSTTAAIDWFSMSIFTIAAIALWVIYCSVRWGVPAQPAANIERLAPGFQATFSPLALVAALIGSLCWLWLLRWRTGKHRQAIWKSLVLPAGGVTLCWLLLMTLGLPILDYARSNRPLAALIARHLDAKGCVAAPGQALSTIAALEYFAHVEVDARSLLANTRCPYMIRQESRGAAVDPPAGWQLVARERRPTDRVNLTAIYRRSSP